MQTDGRLRAPVFFLLTGSPRIRARSAHFHCDIMREAEKLLENEARRRRHRRPAERAVRARAGGERHAVRAHQSRHGGRQRQAVGNRMSRPLPEPQRVPREFQLVGIRHARQRAPRQRLLRDLPDREQHLPDAGPRRGHRTRLVRRLRRAARHVQDGLLPRALRRHPADLRQRPDADELDPRRRRRCGRRAFWARRRTAVSTTGCGNRSATTRRRSSGFNAAFQFASYEGLVRPHSNAISTGAFYNNGPRAARRRLRAPRQDPRHADRAAFRSRVLGRRRLPVRSGAHRRRVRAAQLRRHADDRISSGISTASARPPTSGPGLFYLFVGRAGQRHRQRGGRHAHRRPHQGREHRLDAMGGELHLSAFGAHAGVRRLREDQERIECRVHVQPQPVSRSCATRIPTARAASRAASSSGWPTSSSAPSHVSPSRHVAKPDR